MVILFIVVYFGLIFLWWDAVQIELQKCDLLLLVWWDHLTQNIFIVFFHHFLHYLTISCINASNTFAFYLLNLIPCTVPDTSISGYIIHSGDWLQKDHQWKRNCYLGAYSPLQRLLKLKHDQTEHPHLLYHCLCLLWIDQNSMGPLSCS